MPKAIHIYNDAIRKLGKVHWGYVKYMYKSRPILHKVHEWESLKQQDEKENLIKVDY